MPDFSNPRCYAQKTNKCSESISREHIISNNILEIFEHNKGVKIAGLPWMEHERFNLMSRNALASNILCSAHNNLLSDFDTEAGSLIRCFREFDADFNNPNPINEHRTFDGDLIERWMLKVVCGMIASKQISNQGKKLELSIPDHLVEILFEGAKFPDNWGLYFKVPDNQRFHHFGSFGFMPITANEEVKVGDFLLNNFQFYLVLGDFTYPTTWGIHRIEQIRFKQGDILKIIEFTWESKHDEESWIELNRIGTTQEHPDDWKDWMKK